MGPTNTTWWPNQLNVRVLHNTPPVGDPRDPDSDYEKKFKSLDFNSEEKISPS